MSRRTATCCAPQEVADCSLLALPLGALRVSRVHVLLPLVPAELPPGAV